MRNKWYYITKETFDELQEIFARVVSKKNKLDARRPLSTSVLQRIKHGLFLEWNHHSNAIEGNTLSLNETKLVLEEGITIGGKSLKEHLEIIGHQDAIQYVEKILHPNYCLKGRDILDIHRITMIKIDENIAGRIRNAGVRITGANFIPPAAHKVPTLFDELTEYVATNPDNLHIIYLSALFHHRFVWIHPFFDGNGRVARLVMNLLLMSAGYPPAIILRQDRKKYYAALDMANNGDYRKFFQLVLQSLERSVDIYLSASPGYDVYEPIANIVSEDDVPYNAEYVSLLARQGKIDAYKEGKVWYTSKSAITEYISKRKRARKV